METGKKAGELQKLLQGSPGNYQGVWFCSSDHVRGIRRCHWYPVREDIGRPPMSNFETTTDTSVSYLQPDIFNGKAAKGSDWEWYGLLAAIILLSLLTVVLLVAIVILQKKTNGLNERRKQLEIKRRMRTLSTERQRSLFRSPHDVDNNYAAPPGGDVV